jgi:Family of unknown function (DUF6152)
MSARTLLVLILGGCFLATAPASAHHSFAAEYDRDQKVTVVGKVDKLEWTNPHARLYVDAVDENGKVVHWDFELGPPNNLMRLGWRRDSLVPGTPITVEAFRSRKDKFVASARKVKLADGREVFAGQAFDTSSEE